MSTGLAAPNPKATTVPAGRNIVLCCDGTSNEYSDHNTNVVKLFSILVKDNSKQRCFYDPGLGKEARSMTTLGHEIFLDSYS